MFNLTFTRNLSNFQTYLADLSSFREFFPFHPGRSRDKVFFPGRILPVFYLGKYRPRE